MKQKAIIVGSGISGLSSAKLLSDDYDVEVLEAAPKAGGLIKCDRIDGALFHRVGGHVFNSKNKAVLDWFWAHFNRDEEFLLAKRNAKILFGGQYIGYPLENYLYQLPEEKVREIVAELLEMIAEKRDAETTYDNFKDFLIGNFGTRLYNLYFGPYNSKIWNTDISKVPLEWLDGKLPMPQIKEVIVNNVLKREEGTMVHATFWYAKRGGSQFIVDRLKEGLNLRLSTPLTKLEWKDERLSINDGAFSSDVLVYCGDVRKLKDIVCMEDEELNEAMEAVKDFASNGTSNVLCETDDNDISWLYLPEENFKAHRIIYTGNFSPTNNEEPSGRKTCVVEFSGKQEKDYMLRELAKLPGNLTPLAFNYEPNSYIIHDKQTAAKVKRLKQALVPYNVHLLGRFAEWEYYNMDKCIEAAMELKSRLSQQNLNREKTSFAHSGLRAEA